MNFQPTCEPQCNATTQIRYFRFSDLKGSFSIYRGNNVSKWITDFAEMTDTFLLKDLQKLLFAKKLFEGPAKLYAEFESKAAWNAWECIEERVNESIWWQNQLTTHPPTAG